MLAGNFFFSNTHHVNMNNMRRCFAINGAEYMYCIMEYAGKRTSSMITF